MRNFKGFTLVELMVVVAVVAILASLAYPSYVDKVRKSRRTDAYTAIQQIAAVQERYFATTRAYASFADPFHNTAAMPSPERYYTITVAANADGYVVTATPTAGGAQVADTACATIVLSSNGHKSSTGTYATGGDELGCWH